MADPDQPTPDQARWAEEKRAFAELLARHGVSVQIPYPHSECPLGWVALVDELLRGLASIGVRELAQIKSKFAELRVYLPPGAPAEARALIERATERSRVTCERCGGPSEIRKQRGWYAGLCDACVAAERREQILAASARVMKAHDETFRKLAQ